MSRQAHIVWTFAITSIALFMTTLDNLVVTTALPTIRSATCTRPSRGLEWTVNAYTLTFAVLLMPGAALGDRFGRRRMFLIGLGIFTLASAAAALAPSIELADRRPRAPGRRRRDRHAAHPDPPVRRRPGREARPRARAVGRRLRPRRRARPAVGGAVVEGLSWQWIFWLNVPIGLAADPARHVAAARELRPGRAARPARPRPRHALGLLGIVWGLVRANARGWTSPEIVVSLIAGAVLLVAFVAWERARRGRCCRCASSATARSRPRTPRRSLMFFGMFGSIFLLTQYLQNVQGYSPLEAGLRMLPWTGMPMIVAPIAGRLTDRIGGRPLMIAGLALQAIAIAWLAAITAPDVAYIDLVPPFAIAGVGMALFFAPVANGRPRRRRPARGGQGVRRQQRHPRAGRRVRRRGAGVDLHPPGRVRIGRSLHRRHRPGALGRRRGRRRRGARRDAPSGSRPDDVRVGEPALQGAE